MNRFGIRYLADPTRKPWRSALAGAAVLAALSFAMPYSARADDTQPASSKSGSNYVQYGHDARVHSLQLMESRAADAEAQNDRAVAAEQEQNQRAAAQDQNAASQARNLATPNAVTNQ